MVEYKVAQFLQKLPKMWTHNSYYFKSDAVQNAQTVFQIFGLLL